MRIWLTGASGMVGHHFLGHPGTSVFQILTPSRSELDLLDYSAVLNYVSREQPDLILHAAGKVGGIQANMRTPVQFLLENLDIGRNVVAAAKQAGIRKLINLGSSCMYPRNASNPLQEESILHGELEPTNEGYALAKITISRLCEYIHREDPAYQYKTVIPCNLYGPWDKFNLAHSHMIPAAMNKIHHAHKGHTDEVEIWGEGTARREFMYAGDLADFLLYAIHHFDSMPHVLNAGLGHDYTVNEYYNAIAQIIGYQGRFVHDLSKAVGMKQKLVDVGKLTSFGWQAPTPLLKGLQHTYSFYLQQEADQHNEVSTREQHME